MEVSSLLKDLLSKINSKIAELEGQTGDFMLPAGGTPGGIIQSYLDHMKAQRDLYQQIDDLALLRDTVQAEIDRIADEERAAKEKADAEDRARFVDSETKRITGELSKIDKTSPEASRLLLELTNLRRG